jgi:hypothetical protein
VLSLAAVSDCVFAGGSFTTADGQNEVAGVPVAGVPSLKSLTAPTALFINSARFIRYNTIKQQFLCINSFFEQIAEPRLFPLPCSISSNDFFELYGNEMRHSS